MLIGGIDLGTRKPALAIIAVGNDGTRVLAHSYAPSYTRKIHADKWGRLRLWSHELRAHLERWNLAFVAVEDPRGTVFGTSRDGGSNARSNRDMGFCFAQAVVTCWLLGIRAVELQPQSVSSTLGIVLEKGLESRDRTKRKKKLTVELVRKRVRCGDVTLTEDLADAAAVALAAYERGER